MQGYQKWRTLHLTCLNIGSQEHLKLHVEYRTLKHHRTFLMNSRSAKQSQTPGSEAQVNVDFIQQSLTLLGYPSFPFPHAASEKELAAQILASLLQTRQVN